MVSIDHMRNDALEAFDAAVAAVQPSHLVPDQIRFSAGRILVGDEPLPEARGRRVVMSIGKAAPGLAGAWIETAPDWASEFFLLTPHGAPVPSHVEEAAVILRGAHPYPDSHGERSTRRLLEIADGLVADDLLVVLLSGGGSALMAAPEEGLDLDDVHATTKALLRAGAPITEVNTVRRHLLAAAGGGLARAAAPAPVTTLILSDVLGDPLPDIASGPTVPSASTAEDALAVLERFKIADVVPDTVVHHLAAAARRPVNDASWAKTTSTHVIGNNRTAVEAAAESLRKTGYTVAISPDYLEGEASDRGRELGVNARRTRPDIPTAEIFGGETTVTVRGSGRGGRNQELALSAAFELENADTAVLLAGGTDGVDGLSDNAGAVVDPTTIARLRATGIDPQNALADNDSGTALEAVGDAIRTGPSGTNVCDVTIVLTGPHQN
jgi:glycerate-2-kinase